MKNSGTSGKLAGSSRSAPRSRAGRTEMTIIPGGLCPPGTRRLHEDEVQRRIGAGPELALVERQDRGRLRHAPRPPTRAGGGGPGREGHVAADLPAGLHEPAHRDRDVLAGQVLPVLDARAPGLRAQGRLLVRRRPPSCPRARRGAGRRSRSRPPRPADTRATGWSRRAPPRSRGRPRSRREGRRTAGPRARRACGLWLPAKRTVSVISPTVPDSVPRETIMPSWWRTRKNR